MKNLTLLFYYLCQYIVGKKMSSWWNAAYTLFDSRLAFITVKRLNIYPIIKFRNAFFYVDPYTVIGKNIFKAIEFESEEYRFILQQALVRQYRVVVDVGANIGLYSIALGQQTSVSQVISFEPSKGTRAILKRNIALNNLKNVTVEPLATHSETTILTFYDFYDNAYSSLKPHERGSVKKSYDVQTVRLDQYLIEKNLEIDFIKIDVEGNEENVVIGLCEYFKIRKPDIMIEIFDDTEEKNIANRIIERFKNAGYKVFIITNNGIKPFTGQHNNLFQNYFFSLSN